MYGNKITQSMQETIDETNRRRLIQHQYNVDHNITPEGIQKAVLATVDGTEEQETPQTSPATFSSQKDLKRAMDALEKDMLDAAENLKFERAADFRDQLLALKEKLYQPNTLRE